MLPFEDDAHGVEDALGRRCEECGVALTQAEVLAAREAGGPFLCTVHAAEALPADDLDVPPSAA